MVHLQITLKIALPPPPLPSPLEGEGLGGGRFSSGPLKSQDILNIPALCPSTNLEMIQIYKS
jgi:hypothetical protein